MKKLTRRSFTAAGILAALGVSGLVGCAPDFNPSRNEVECVYGPPEYFSSGSNSATGGSGSSDDGAASDSGSGNASSDFASSGSVNPGNASMSSTGSNDASKTASFDPADNENEDVYGPPPDDAEEYDPEVRNDNAYDPRANENVVVYGPPR